jgi:hypothetical protein
MAAISGRKNGLLLRGVFGAMAKNSFQLERFGRLICFRVVAILAR